MVSTLPERPDLDQLRRRAKELRNAVGAGDPQATERVRAYTSRKTLAAAQLAIAREFGFSSWTQLTLEVRRKRLIVTGDVAGLRDLLAQHPDLATAKVSSELSGQSSSSALEYVAVARFHGSLDRDVAGDLARVLLGAGAGPDGPYHSGDTPLVTAASYGEVDMVRALLAGGADVESVGHSIPGGGTALAHAVHYGIPVVVDLLAGAGAVVHDIVEAAGVGTIPAPMLRESSTTDLVAALRAASVCGRLDAIDRLLAAGADPNVTTDGGTCLHWAAWHANADSIEHLLGRGADPTRRDDEHDMTPGQWYLYRRDQLESVDNPDCRRGQARIERALGIATPV
jgi:hypothetical protein